MEYVNIFATKDNPLKEKLFSVVFDEDDLSRLGINSDDIHFDEEYLGQPEFHKLRLLWLDANHLSDIYLNNIDLFKDKYWNGITLQKFVNDVVKASPNIFKRIEEDLNKGEIDYLFSEEFEHSDVVAARKYEDCIKVKAKFGSIFGKCAFRIYAVRIENGMYVITGGAIKISRDLDGAPHTKIERDKVRAVYNDLKQENVDCGLALIDLIIEKEYESAK